jgi:hypothetical protein
VTCDVSGTRNCHQCTALMRTVSREGGCADPDTKHARPYSRHEPQSISPKSQVPLPKPCAPTRISGFANCLRLTRHTSPTLDLWAANNAVNRAAVLARMRSNRTPHWHSAMNANFEREPQRKRWQKGCIARWIYRCSALSRWQPQGAEALEGFECHHARNFRRIGNLRAHRAGGWK